MKQTKQMSESIRLGMLLAISGGFMDAYSYIAAYVIFRPSGLAVFDRCGIISVSDLFQGGRYVPV